MPLFSIDLSGEFQSFLIVEALSAAIGIGVMKLHSGRTFVSVLGYRVSRFSDGLNLSDPEHVNVAQIGEAGNGDFTIHLLFLKHDGTQNSNKKAVPSFFLNSLPTLTPCQKGRTWEPA